MAVVGISGVQLSPSPTNDFVLNNNNNNNNNRIIKKEAEKKIKNKI
jgi:hypothetical protein